MNTSQPVTSYVRNIGFNFLSKEEIRALSARRITNSTTFDTLLNPVPGGLYSPELGQFADNACSTCGLKTPQCRGHPGHIELPVPCYHPLFIDQVLRLLRASCVYCGKLKLQRVIVNRYACQLRLIQYGLMNEVEELEEAVARAVHNPKGGQKSVPDGSDMSDGEEDLDAKSIIDANERFVRRAIKKATRNGTVSTEKTEAVNTKRRLLVMKVMENIIKGKKCGNCGGINHGYRKDGAVKIFKKNLTEKEHIAMVQAGLKAKDPVIEQRRQARRERRRKRKRDEDEGVADLDTSSDDENADIASSSEEEPEIAGGTLVDEATETAARGKTEAPTKKEEYLNPSHVLARLTQLFESDSELLSLLYGVDPRRAKDGRSRASADMFFIHNLLVPPNRYRPEAMTGNGALAEAPENTTYKNILNACDNLTLIQRELTGKDSSRNPQYRPRTYFDFENTWLTLQESVNTVMDSNLSSLGNRANIRTADGVKQKLEKKEGMFRQFMMGKRVNFAARTVLSPDPNIETNEIGVPPVFAMTLTYPEPVTLWNLEDMQEAVRNGPRVWPGAVAIEEGNGSVISLERKNAEERTALANSLLATTMPGNAKGARPKKVLRHLNNGDIVIMNRQPTLHKPSMMCHRARVLQGEKTLRMHYANCNTYNADFDGDEMNMHFPQNELARAEALSIADTDHQYLSGTAGKPLRGLIQDHISMCVWLTSRDMFFERGDYMNLLYSALRPENNHCISGRLETYPPAILKPKPLWTGKQVVSSVLKNLTPTGANGLTMTGKSTTESAMWGQAGREENIVIFQDGQHLQGILDKKQIGPSDGGLVNAVYEAYGHTVAGKLLSVLGRLLTRLLHMRAFSCGVEDVIFTKQGEAERRSALAGADAVGLEVAARYVSLADKNPKSGDHELQRRLEEVLRDDDKQAGLDSLNNLATKDLSSAVTNACMPLGLSKPFPKNQMQTMTTSGAKGSKVNASLISCNLGQQVLEGRRVPVMVSGKSLPCFKPFESNIRAGGYIVDRFLTGIRPQEYFFHTMAGREGLIDTAVKTSRSGYLQRCLIKGMEGLRVEHDTSVRDTADGSIIQFIYGEDGLDVAKSKYLYDFKFAAENFVSLVRAFDIGEETLALISEKAREHTKKALSKYRKTGDLGASDPALSVYSPSQVPGSISERIFAESKQWVDENKDRVIRDKKKNIEGLLTKKTFNAMLDIRYLRSLVEAGEAVGVIAGQSIGEPSTQMTLNTFHLAGHAAKNVTLGIPRLREIVMTAAPFPSTPTMTLRMQAGISIEDAKKFAKGISRLSLADIVDKVSVTESTGKGVAYAEAKMYKIRMDLFPSKEYQKEYAIRIDDVANTIETRLLPRLQAVIRKELKKRGEMKKFKEAAKIDALPEIGKSVGRVEQENVRPTAAEDEGDDEDSGPDSDAEDDATGDKTRKNRQQAGYDAYEDEDEKAIAAENREATPELESEDETYGGSPRGSPERTNVDDDDGGEHGLAHAIKVAAIERQNRIKSDRKTNDVVNFSFDDARGGHCSFTLEYDSTTPKMLMLNMVESALRASLIQSVPGISACMLDDEASKKQSPPVPVLSASGVNLPALWDYQHVVHPDHLYTNSVHAMLVHYGVEAARATIVRELHAVFSGHGISVDPRHLTLIADHQTRAGAYQAFSRIGYRANPSPFMKMSFETTLAFVRDAVLEGDADPLMNPSARIVTGRLGTMGTGGFDVFMPLADKRKDEKAAAVVDEVDEVDEDSDEDIEMDED